MSSENVLSKALGLVGLSMVPTILGAYFGAQLIGQMSILVAIVMLIAAICLIFAIIKTNNPILFLVFSAVMGASAGPLLAHVLELQNGVNYIVTAATLTASALFGIVAYVKKTKKDFSYLGGFLFGALIILLVGGVINLFVGSSVMTLALSMVGAVIFTAYILYDVSQVVTGKETNYVFAALSIYLDVFNLFIDLLRIIVSIGGDD